jgi:thiamine biosynthesis lipoprotein
LTHPAARTATGTEPLVLVPPTAPLNPAPRGAVMHRWSGTSMGCTWRLVLATLPTTEVAHVPRTVEARLARLVAELSHWERDSALSRFNRLPEGTWQTLTPDFATVMYASLALAEASGGAFDPALGDRITAWGFGPRGRFDQPGFMPPAPVSCALGLRQAQPEREGVPLSPIAPSLSKGPSATTWRDLQLRGDHLLQPGGCVLDLSAIAKGHAVDVVAALLRQLGFGHFLFELGGELAGEGLKPDGQPWWVALERPSGAGASLPPLRAALVGMSLATSGDYRQGFTDSHGRWCSHTLDPRSGEPVRHALASVSVLHERCMQADALATVLFVLGPDDGDAWARTNGVAAWFVARMADGGWREWPSPALADWLD